MGRKTKINIKGLMPLAIAAIMLACFPLRAQAGYLPFNTNSNMKIGIGTSTPQGALVVTNGNVGIGTWAPAGTLDVEGTLSTAIFNGNVGIGTTVTGADLLVVGNATNGQFDVDNTGDISANGNIITTDSGMAAYFQDYGVYTSFSTSQSYPGGGNFGFGSENNSGVDSSISAITLTDLNSSSNTQGISIGVVSNAGASSYAPNFVIDQITGATSYQERMRIDQNGNVGIGSTAPGQILDVQGTVRDLGEVLTSNVPAVTTNELYNNSGSLYFNGSAVGGGGSSQWITNAGVGIGTYNNVGIGTTTPQAAFVVTNGNVGIGTWTAAGGNLIIKGGGNVGIGSAWPGQLLDVQGNVRATGETINGNVGIGTSANQGALSVMNGNVGIGTFAPSALFQVAGTGNVGISSTAPGAPLDVQGLARMTGFQLGTSTTSGYVLTANASGVGTWQAASGGGSSQWITNAGVGIGTYSNVGIGTAAPKALLDVEGTLSTAYFNSNVGIGTWTASSGLQMNESVAFYRTIATGNASSAGQTIIGVTSTASAYTITLSNSDKVAGRVIIVKDESGGAGTNHITITPASGTIDGSASVVISVAYGVVRVYSDGSNWFTF